MVRVYNGQHLPEQTYQPGPEASLLVQRPDFGLTLKSLACAANGDCWTQLFIE